MKFALLAVPEKMDSAITNRPQLWFLLGCYFVQRSLHYFFFYWHFRKCKATKKLVSWYDERCVFYKGYWRWAKMFLLHLFHVLFPPLLQFLFHHILHTQSFRSARRTVQSFPPFNSFRPSITFPSFSRPALRKIKTKWTSFTL